MADSNFQGKRGRAQERLDLLVFALILLLGFVGLQLVAQVAIRPDPTWQAKADMLSRINPDENYTDQLEVAIAPLRPEVLTPPAWNLGQFLTPEGQSTIIPPLVFPTPTRTPLPATATDVPASPPTLTPLPRPSDTPAFTSTPRPSPTPQPSPTPPPSSTPLPSPTPPPSPTRRLPTSTPLPPPTETPKPPKPPKPTSTPLPPPSDTPLPPTATLGPPTVTLVPPTATLVPPTATLGPPTAAPTMPPRPPSATPQLPSPSHR